jgi:hypothetical protein
MSNHTVRVSCAWCGDFLRVSPATAAAAMDGGESHGICRPCASSVLRSMGVEMERTPDGFSKPRYLEPKLTKEAA